MSPIIPQCIQMLHDSLAFPWVLKWFEFYWNVSCFRKYPNIISCTLTYINVLEVCYVPNDIPYTSMYVSYLPQCSSAYSQCPPYASMCTGRFLLFPTFPYVLKCIPTYPNVAGFVSFYAETYLLHWAHGIEDTDTLDIDEHYYLLVLSYVIRKDLLWSKAWNSKCVQIFRWSVQIRCTPHLKLPVTGDQVCSDLCLQWEPIQNGCRN